jgi:hypothetical protein
MLAASALAACSGSTLSANRPIFIPPLNPATSVCDTPALLPNRAMTQAEVETFWATDRASLVKCGMNLAALVEHYQNLAVELSLAGKRSAN